MARKAHIVGSRNVFADLGHPRPAEALAKAELARTMARLSNGRVFPRRLPHRFSRSISPKCLRLSVGAWPASLWTGRCGFSSYSEATLRSWFGNHAGPGVALAFSLRESH